MNLPLDTKFAELIDYENGCWKQGLVQSRFQPYDASQILQIPLSPALLGDVLINLGKHSGWPFYCHKCNEYEMGRLPG